MNHPIQIRTRRRPTADVAQGGRAVHGLAASGQGDSGQRVVDRFAGADLHPAEAIDKRAETAETDLGVVVEAQTSGRLDGLHQ